MKKEKPNTLTAFPEKILLSPGAFVFCERTSGTMRFQVEAAPNGAIPVEKAASMLAMHCLVRGQTPLDYVVLVRPQGGLLDPVGRRAGELLNVGRAIRSDVELTHRETEVLEWLVQGLSNKEIAGHLNVAERTVKFHVSGLLAKFHVPDRFVLMRRAMSGTQLRAEDPAGEVAALPAGSLRLAESEQRPEFGASVETHRTANHAAQNHHGNGHSSRLRAIVGTAISSPQRSVARSRPS